MENCHLCHILLISEIIHPQLYIQIIPSGIWMAPLHYRSMLPIQLKVSWNFPISLRKIFLKSLQISRYFAKIWKMLWPFLWIKFNCINAAEQLSGGSILLTTKYSKVSGANVINLGMMKSWVNHGATYWVWTQTPWSERATGPFVSLWYVDG